MLNGCGFEKKGPHITSKPKAAAACLFSAECVFISSVGDAWLHVENLFDNHFAPHIFSESQTNTGTNVRVVHDRPEMSRIYYNSVKSNLKGRSASWSLALDLPNNPHNRVPSSLFTFTLLHHYTSAEKITACSGSTFPSLFCLSLCAWSVDLAEVCLTF